jgi:hypothetical protein
LVFLAVSGIKIPDAVFVSAATGSIRTRSESGLMFKAMILFFNYISSVRNCAILLYDISYKKTSHFDRLAFL